MTEAERSRQCVLCSCNTEVSVRTGSVTVCAFQSACSKKSSFRLVCACIPDLIFPSMLMHVIALQDQPARSECVVVQKRDRCVLVTRAEGKVGVSCLMAVNAQCTP